MCKKSGTRNSAFILGKPGFRKDVPPCAASASVIFALVIFAVMSAAALSLYPSREAWGGDGGAVMMPSRFSDSNASWFTFGGNPPQIVCQAGKTTNIELEPGERIEKYFITDSDKWSISAAWSGYVNNLTTHVLLRSFFPGLKSKLTIYTDRRAYEFELTSGLNVSHMARVAFRYPVTFQEPPEEEIPPGKYRDLLVKYRIIDGAEEKEDEDRRVDGADLNFRYDIKHLGKKRPLWTPKSVYDIDGRTYIVLPHNSAGQGKGKLTSSPSLYIVDNNTRSLTKMTALKENLYVVDRLFDEAIIKADDTEITIRRIIPYD